MHSCSGASKSSSQRTALARHFSRGRQVTRLMDFSRQSWRKGCFFVSAVAEEGYRDQADDPQSGELPAAVRVGEEEAGRSVHRDNGAKQIGMRATAAMRL